MSDIPSHINSEIFSMLTVVRNLCIIIFISTSPLLASTGLVRGLIVEVTSVDGNSVRFVMRQDIGGRDGFGQKLKTYTTLPTTIVTFGGKEVEAASGIAVGRTAFILIGRKKMKRVAVLQLEPVDILPEPEQDDPNNGALELSVPVQLGKGKGALRGTLGLSVVVRDGVLHSGYIRHGHSMQPLALDGLKLKNKVLSGSITTDLAYHKLGIMSKDRQGKSNLTRLTFSATLGKEESVPVSLDLWGHAFETSARSEFRAYRQTPESGRIVFFAGQGGGSMYDIEYAGTQVTAIRRGNRYGSGRRPVAGELRFANGIIAGSIGGLSIQLAHVDMELQGVWRHGGESGVSKGGFVPIGQPLVWDDLKPSPAQ